MKNPVGTLVRTNGQNWDRVYRNQVFLVTDVVVRLDGRTTFLLQDRIGGGFIWAETNEVKIITGTLRQK